MRGAPRISGGFLPSLNASQAQEPAACWGPSPEIPALHVQSAPRVFELEDVFSFASLWPSLVISFPSTVQPARPPSRRCNWGHVRAASAPPPPPSHLKVKAALKSDVVLSGAFLNKTLSSRRAGRRGALTKGKDGDGEKSKGRRACGTGLHERCRARIRSERSACWA